MYEAPFYYYLRVVFTGATAANEIQKPISTLFRCQLHGLPTHDFFISYRVASDAALAKDLAQNLNMGPRKGARQFTAFLDTLCLPDGKVTFVCEKLKVASCGEFSAEISTSMKKLGQLCWTQTSGATTMKSFI